ncbi:MAG: sialate O-acetylesterase [Janthinobacterium lividum]
MSRFVSALPTLPPLGAEFALNPATGLYDVVETVPQPLSGPLFATDLAILVRDTGPAGAPNLVPFSVTMGAVLTGGTVLFAAQPTATRVYQRDTRTGGAFGLGAGAVGVFVTLSSAATSLDYRLRDAATPATVLQYWATLAGATAAGSVSLSPAIPAGPHRYLMDVRASGDAAHAVLGTQAFGVGEVIGVAGQSLGTNMLVAGWSPEGTIASAGVTPAANGYEFAPSMAPEDGNSTYVAPSPTQWTAPADDTAYGSAFAAEFLRLVTSQAGVVAALAGFTYGGSSITTWQPGQSHYTTLRGVLDQVGRIGALIWIQGHSDAQNGMSAATYQAQLVTLFTDLATHYAGPGGTLGAFPRLICSIPSLNTTFWGTSAQVAAIRAGALAYVASDPRARYVAALDMGLSSDGTHPNQAGRVPMAHHFYRAFMGTTGIASLKPGPAITGASRTAGSAVIKVAVAQGAGGTALVGVGTPANQFTVYPAGNLSGALAIASLAIASATEIDLTLSAAPGYSQAVDVWYRLAGSDTAAVTGSGIYDNATDADGLTLGRQLQLAAAAITAAAASPYPLTFAGAAGPLTGPQVLTPLAGADMTGAALDGNGNLTRPTADYQRGFFGAAGIVPDGRINYTFGAGLPARRSITLVFRASADGQNAYLMTTVDAGGGNNLVALEKLVGGTSTNLGTATIAIADNIASLGVSYAGSTFTMLAGGTPTTATFTDTGITADGYAGLGSGNLPLLVSQVGIQPAATPAAFTVRNTSQGPVPSSITVPASGTGAVSASVQVYAPDGTNSDAVAFAIGPSNTTNPPYTTGDNGVNAGDFQDFAAALGGISPATFACNFKVFPNGHASGSSRIVYLWAFLRDSGGNYPSPVVLTNADGTPAPITVSYQ